MRIKLQLVLCSDDGQEEIVTAVQEPTGAGAGSVANLVQGAMKGQLALSVEGLGSQGVEQFGRSAALVSLFDHQLSFLDHVHEFDADERGLRRVKRLEP